MNEMNVVLKNLIGIFLILHGLVLPIMALVPSDKAENAHVGSFWTESWLLGTGPEVKVAIYVLSAVAALAFILSGMGFMGLFVSYAALKVLLLVGASVSLVLIVFFWLPWFILGVVLNLLILMGVIFNGI